MANMSSNPSFWEYQITDSDGVLEWKRYPQTIQDLIHSELEKNKKLDSLKIENTDYTIIFGHSYGYHKQRDGNGSTCIVREWQRTPEIIHDVIEHDWKEFMSKHDIQKSKVTKLELGGRNTRAKVDDNDVLQLAKILHMCTSLRVLCVTHCNLTDVSGVALGNALAKSASLTHLDLEGNMFGEQTGIAIGAALKRSTLEILDLHSNNLEEKGGAAIIQGLKNNATLSVLNLGLNSLGKDFGLVVCDALMDNHSLRELHLGWNKLGNEIGLAIAKVLETNTSLEDIRLWNNDLGERSGIALVYALARNLTVTKLDLTNNIGISPATLAKIKFALSSELKGLLNEPSVSPSRIPVCTVGFANVGKTELMNTWRRTTANLTPQNDPEETAEAQPDSIRRKTSGITMTPIGLRLDHHLDSAPVSPRTPTTNTHTNTFTYTSPTTTPNTSTTTNNVGSVFGRLKKITSRLSFSSNTSPTPKKTKDATDYATVGITSWDFAGQAEYYLSHEFVMRGCGDSVFVVLFRIDTTHSVEAQGLFYWLQFIATMCSEQHRTPTVFIGGTFRPEGDAYDREATTVWTDGLLEHAKRLFRDVLHFPQRHSYHMDCRKHNDPPVVALRNALAKAVEDMRNQEERKVPPICESARSMLQQVKEQVAAHEAKRKQQQELNPDVSQIQHLSWENEMYGPLMSRVDFEQRVLGQLKVTADEMNTEEGFAVILDAHTTEHRPSFSGTLWESPSITPKSKQLFHIITKYLHDVGDILWFDIDGIRDTVILTPNVFCTKIIGAIFRPDAPGFNIDAVHQGGGLVPKSEIAATFKSQLGINDTHVDAALAILCQLGLCHRHQGTIIDDDTNTEDELHNGDTNVDDGKHNHGFNNDVTPNDNLHNDGNDNDVNNTDVNNNDVNNDGTSNEAMCNDDVTNSGSGDSRDSYLFPGALAASSDRLPEWFVPLPPGKRYVVGRRFILRDSSKSIFSPGCLPQIQVWALGRYNGSLIWRDGVIIPHTATCTLAEAGIQIHRPHGSQNGSRLTNVSVSSITLIVRGSHTSAANNCIQLLHELCEKIRASCAAPLVEEALPPVEIVRPANMLDVTCAGYTLPAKRDHTVRGVVVAGCRCEMEELYTGACVDVPHPPLTTPYPVEWEGSDFSPVTPTRLNGGKHLLVEIAKDRDEFQTINDNMNRSLPTAVITKVQRVQNEALWTKYFNARSYISLSTPDNDAHETLAWHGTNTTDPLLICRDWQAGFDINRSIIEYEMHGDENIFFNTEGKSYGTGVYLAEHAIYSHAMFPHDVDDGDAGLKQLLLAKVARGNIKDYGAPLPERCAAIEPEGCHSVSGTEGDMEFLRHSKQKLLAERQWTPAFQKLLENGSVFGRQYVVYRSERVYPAYLVTYRDSEAEFE